MASTRRKKSVPPQDPSAPPPAMQGYRLRFHPTQAQERLLAKTLGCCRFLHNELLGFASDLYREQGLSCSTRDLEGHKQRLRRIFPWLEDAPDTCLVQERIDLQKAFGHFFRDCGKRGGRKAGYPRFRKFSTAAACRFQLDYRNGRDHPFQPLTSITLPKIGKIHPQWTQVPHGRPRMVTITRDASRRWFVSFACEEPDALAGGTHASPLVPVPGSLPDLLDEIAHFGCLLTPETLSPAETYHLVHALARNHPGTVSQWTAPLVLNPGKTGRNGDRVQPRDLAAIAKAVRYDRRKAALTALCRVADTGDAEVDAFLNAVRTEALALKQDQSIKPRHIPPELLDRLAKSPALRAGDLGLKDILTLSDGTRFPDITRQLRKLLGKQKHLKKTQRVLDRKEKGSNRYERQRQRVAKVHAEVTDARRDLHEKLSNLITGPGVSLICLEGIFVAGMLRNRKIAKSMQNMALGQLRLLITHKAKARRVAALFTSRWDPTSKTCHQCGHHHAELTLAERTWTCPGCGAKLDRDLNAAINIIIFATGGYPGRRPQGRVDAEGHTGKDPQSGKPSSKRVRGRAEEGTVPGKRQAGSSGRGAV